MNRRQFVGGSILTAGGFIASNRLLAKNGLNIDSKKNNSNSVDIEILCDEPGNAYDSLSSFLKLLNVTDIKIEEHQLVGNYTGDIVFIYNNCLVNYKADNTKHSHLVKNISENLRLPRKIQNPTLIKAVTNTHNSSPKFVSVFKDNRIVDRLKINENKNDIHIPSDKGELYFSIKNNSVFATHSSCKHKTCIHTGAISRAGQNIICVPNNIRIALDGYQGHNIDSITF
ncbi:MAG: hypothetical protein A2X61_06830 [Ignavibacteria bacterium GWB2_35_12]|nr:MAG: hypothetical protein A2X63_10570 [Ignavibacteria bacterium GWA2_35_8]OGU40097.1 MAG: hypothetical protein A2X61_06830 [Ignavibacteria bacterium GWB2_35_12]OGU87410.1 MAG: hypothetical protein A2220_01370 [Ignavibacteria bacterium RIFOXYA2_FULL_35_10]OGV22027.1 MAG: hypothetical protein A2475_09330 [Ignavibacteria bacterium RIFOXYC2_FULL_35_21]